MLHIMFPPEGIECCPSLIFNPSQARKKRKAQQDEAAATRRLRDEEDRQRRRRGLFYGSSRTEDEELLRLCRVKIEICIGDIRKWEQVLREHRPECELKSDVDKLQAQLKRTQADLKRAETPPPAVFHPLPEKDDSAHAVLFFLYTPDLLSSLSRMTILAEQLLLPWPWCCDKRWPV